MKKLMSAIQDLGRITARHISVGLLSLVVTAQMTPIAVAEHQMKSGIESHISQTSLASHSAGMLNGTKMSVTMTGYSSTPDQTDDTPFTTASGTTVRDGVVAANFLPFGTKVMIPKLFGNKIFIVEDRMHQRFSDRMDLWFAERESAVKFGKRTAEIVVL